MRKFPFPIRYSVPLILLVLIILSSALLFAREFFMTRQGIENRMMDDARFTGVQTSTILENLYQRDLRHVALSVVSQLAVKPFLGRAYVIDENNSVISSTSFDNLNKQLDQSMLFMPLSDIYNAREVFSSRVQTDSKSETIMAVYPFLLSIKPGSIRPEKRGILYFEYDMSGEKKNALSFLLKIFLEGFVIFFILCGGVFFFFNKTISLRVYRLLDTAKQLAGGDLDARSRLKGSDELAVISRAFDQMADDIKIKNNELHSAKDVLERRVAERTSELNKLTNQLASAKDAAEAASEAKTQFLARMSHEIRTPMHAVMSMTGFVLKTDLTDKQREYLQVIQVSAENLLAIINDILDFSKIEAGKMEIETIDFDLHNTLQTVIKNHQPFAEKKQIYLKITVSEDTPRFVNGDPVRFSQVLSNLITNAIKFTDKGGVNVYVKQSQNGKISFSINDTGIGIPEAKIEHIFESFMQADSSTTRKYGGTGLGLPISKQLVELMGGEIKATSRQGMGSSFFFTIAFSRAEFKEQPSVAYEQTPHGDGQPIKELKILLAEDDPVNVKVAGVFISEIGWTMAHAENGMEALRMLSEQKFDTVLMDLSMPDMDGLEACNRLRNGEAGEINRNVPVIAMTAHAFSGIREKCLKAGMNDYISKPVDFSRLKDIILYLIDTDFELAEPKDDDKACDESVLDIESTLRRLNGNKVLFIKLLSMYVANTEKMIEELEKAVNDRVNEETAKIAHRYKGSSSTVGAGRVLKAVTGIESGAQTNNSELIAASFNALKSEIIFLEKEAKKFLSSESNS